MLVSIQHEMDITYSAPVSESTMDLHMVPQTDGHQTLLEFKLVAGPEAPVFEFLDWQGNRVHHLSIAAFHDREIIVSNFNIEIHPQRWRFEQLDDSLPMTTLDHRHQDYLLPHGPVQFESRIEQLANEIGLNNKIGVGQALAAVATRLKTFATSPEDRADWALSLLRHLGIPARYVSGYLFRRGMKVLDVHAWIEAFVPSVGWIGIDPTLGQPSGDGHVALAIGRSHLDAPLQRGMFQGDAQQKIKHGLRGSEIRKHCTNDWSRTPRFDNRQLVELMLRDRTASKESIEQQIFQ